MTTEYYYEMYGIALKAYNAAVDNISSCNRNYKRMVSVRDEAKDNLEDVKTEIKRHERALKKIEKIIKKKTEDDGIDERYKDTDVAIDAFSSTYKNLISHNEVENKDIKVILEPQMKRTSDGIDLLFSQIGVGRNVVIEKITELNKEKVRLEEQIERYKQKISQNRSDLAEYEKAKSTAEWNMAYYKSFL